MNKAALEAIGLTNSEIKVYLALLELGSSSTGPIVEKARVASSKIYEILEKLMQKGLASFVISSGTKYFEAADPKRILDYLEEKQAMLVKQTKDIKSIIPELELKQKLTEKKSETLVFKGIKGAKTAFDDILSTLKKGQELTVVGFHDTPKPFQRFLVHWHEGRAKKGIKCRIMNGLKLQDMQDRLAKLNHTKAKILPPEAQSEVATITYADKTLFSLPLDQLWIQIKNKRLADANRKRFETIWNQEVVVHKGFEQVTARFDQILEELGEDDEYYVLGAYMAAAGKRMKKWLLDFHRRRVQRKVPVKFLIAPDMSEFIFYELTHTGDPEMKLANVKILPEGYAAPMQINLFKNNRVFMFVTFKEPMFFEIESATLYNVFKGQFDSLWDQETRVLKGLDAVQQLFEEMLETGHADFIGARGYFMDRRPKFIDDWEQRAIKQGFTMRNIVDKSAKGHRITKLPFAETRYNIPKEFSPLSVFWISKDKVVISNWVEKEPIAIVIENKHLYKLYKQQFEVMWQHKMVAK